MSRCLEVITCSIAQWFLHDLSAVPSLSSLHSPGLCSQVFTPIAFITLSLMARLEYNPSSLLDMGQNHIGSPDRIMRFLQHHSAGCRLPGLRPVVSTSVFPHQTDKFWRADIYLSASTAAMQL